MGEISRVRSHWPGSLISTVLIAGLLPSSIVSAQGALSRPVSFRLEVAPILTKAGCNMGACHGNLNGKGGFRLSLRGEDPGFDWLMITREAAARRIDLASPPRSLIVLKPAGAVPHEGGPRFGGSSSEARTLTRWIQEGARDDSITAPKVTRIAVEPGERIVAYPGRAQQLAVTAEFSDGSKRDITSAATYDVNDPTQAKVSHDGLVEVAGPVETAVSIRYATGRSVSRLAFLPNRPGFVWPGLPETNPIDRQVFQKLKRLTIRPSERSIDSIFLRRAYLDAIGCLPTPHETRAFLDDANPAKRDQLIDTLLQRPEFADFWALKWADVLRNEEKTMGQKGVWIFQRWLRDQIAADVPLDQFVRSMIVSQGTNWSEPATSFFRTNRDPFIAAESVGQVFLGVRIQCARCHNHPFDVWTQDDYYGLAGVFSNIKRKEINNVRDDNLDKHEINGDVFVYLQGEAGMKQPRSGERLPPKAPGGPTLDSAAQDPRPGLADWLTRDNPQFARNMANRIWFHLLGRGIVDPVDDFRESNPPSNPALLSALADSLVGHGYRLKPLVAEIMKSATYQLGSEPDETNASDEANFSKATVRLLAAEVLLDALGDVFEVAEEYRDAPRSMRASRLPGVETKDPFLKVFGKPDRLLTCECERSESTTLAQAFQFINADVIRSKIESSKNRIGRLLDSNMTDEQRIEELTLAALSRYPSTSETAGILKHLREAADKRLGWEDVAWALVNSKEFLLRH